MVKKISIFFPAYNEEKNIEKIIKETIEVMNKNSYEYEIGVVNDGSRDSTAEKVMDIEKKNKGIRLISHHKNLGYSAATRTSFKEASGDIICVIDSDGQYNLEEIPLLIKKIEDGYDLIVGYRKKIKGSPFRFVLSKGYNLLFKLLFMVNYRDIDCGFRALKKSAARKINLKYGNIPVGAELFVRALENNLNIGQIPVTHYYRTTGKSTFKFWKMPEKVFRIFLNVIRLRIKSLK